MTNTKWEITSEIFAIPYNEDFILYAPLKGTIALTNKAAAKWVAQARLNGPIDSIPSSLLRLKEVGLFEPVDAPATNGQMKSITVEAFRPTGLIILTTSFCNFRCVYCYAAAAAQSKQVDFEVAKAAIRMVINNALEAGEEIVEIAFHGGGEPTTVFPFVTKCVTYARESAGSKLDVAASIVTNGYLSERQIQWLGDNMNSIQVSLDGPADVHNLQRPLFNGAPTFEKVVNSVHRLIELGVPNLLIKSTISQPVVNRMPEIAQFLCETFPLNRFHFGPVLEFGRSRQTGFAEPNVTDFLKYAARAQEVASTYNKHIVISGAQETFPYLRREFCGLTEPNFAITVDGRISGCYEVIENSDPRSDTFHYGEFRDGEFYFDLEKIAQLRCRQQILAPKCHRCFARWQCAGDCQIRWYDETTGQYDDSGDFRCAINRELVKRELIKVLEKAHSDTALLPVQELPAHSYVD